MVQRCVLVACETEGVPLLLAHSVVYMHVQLRYTGYNPFLPATSLSRKKEREKEQLR